MKRRLLFAALGLGVFAAGAVLGVAGIVWASGPRKVGRR